MNHTPGAGFIARPVGQQSGALPLSYGCDAPLLNSARNMNRYQYFLAMACDDNTDKSAVLMVMRIRVKPGIMSLLRLGSFHYDDST